MKKSKLKIVINWKAFVFFLVMIRVFYLITTNFNYPEKHIIQNFPLAIQPDAISCGPTSCFMVLSYYKKNSTIEKCKEEARTKWFTYSNREIGMTTPEYIRKCLNSENLNYSLGRGNLHGIKSRVCKNRPIIVLLRSSQYTWHYVVVIGYDSDYLIIADPGYGKTEYIPNEIFVKSWNFTGDMRGNNIDDNSIFLNFILQLTEVNSNTMVY